MTPQRLRVAAGGWFRFYPPMVVSRSASTRNGARSGTRWWAALLLLQQCMTAPALMAADYAATLLSYQPTNYWRLNEISAIPPGNRAVNSSALGRDFDGFYNANALHPVRGALVASTDTAAAFNGTPHTWVSIANFPALNPTNAFTVEAWLNPNTSVPNDDAPVCPLASVRRTAIEARGWVFYQLASGWNFRLGNSAGYLVNLTSGALPQPGLWQHVAATFDGQTATLFVNGVAQATATIRRPYEPNLTVPLGIGARGDDTYWFNGVVDEVALYGRALSPTELQGHYANGVSAFPPGPYSQLILSQSPLAYYRLNEPTFVAGNQPVAANSGTSGSRNHGRYVFGTTNGVAGPRPSQFNGFGGDNRAAEFCGAGGAVSTPYQLSFLSRFTALGWVRRGTQHTAGGGFFGQADLLEVGEANGGAAIEVYVAAYQRGLKFPYPFPTNQWGMLAVVADGTQVTVYTNGYPAGTLGGTVLHYGSSPGTFNIGAGVLAETGDWFRGAVDEVAVLHRALSANEVRALYEAAGVAPYISVQPVAPSGPLFAGNNVTLRVTALGTPTLTYRWRKDGVLIQFQTASNLVLNAVTPAQSGDYTAVIQNDYGAVTSAVVRLNILPPNPPVIVEQPIPRTRFVGSQVVFSVSAAATPPLTYQWQFNGANLVGQNGPALSLENLPLSADGSYRVVVMNPLAPNGVPSAGARLTMIAPSRYAAAVLADDPRAYWPLGETNGFVANDAWGGYDGQYVNVDLAQPGYSAGDTNRAAAFAPERDSRMLVEESGAFDVDGYSVSLTVEAWVRPRSLSGLQRICSNGATPAETAGGYAFGTDGNQYLRFTVFGSTEIASPPIDPPLLAGKWYHVAVVVADSQVTFYVNGQSLGPAYALLNGILSSPEPFQLGRNPLVLLGEEEFDGLLDEVAFYDRALLPTDLKAHYEARDDGRLPPVFSVQPVATRLYNSRPTTFTAIAEGSAPVRYQWLVNGFPVDKATNATLAWAAPVGTYSLAAVARNAAGQAQTTPVTITVDPYPATCDLSQGLVTHLKLDGNPNDTSGRGNNGTLVGTPAYVAGQIGSAGLSCRSDPDVIPKVFNYLTLGQSPDFLFSSNVNFSVAFWTKFTGLQDAVPWAANNLNSLGDAGLAIAPSPDSWAWSLNAAPLPKLWGGIAVVNSYPSPNPLSDSQWHHLTFTFDRAGNAVTYVDGLPVNAMSLRPALDWNVSTGLPLNIGQASGTYAGAATFAMDDLGIWRRALSAYEVDTMYLVGQRLRQTFAPDQPTQSELRVSYVDGRMRIEWNGGGVLQTSTRVTDGWVALPSAKSPYSVQPTAATSYYRVRQ